MFRLTAPLASATMVTLAMGCSESVGPADFGSTTAHDGGLDAGASIGDGGQCSPPDATIVSVPENGSDPRCPPSVASGGVGFAVRGPSCCPSSPICSYEPGGATSALCVEPENIWIYCSDAFGACQELSPARAGELCCQFAPCSTDGGRSSCSCSGHHVVCN
jgi:hypothetical protein